MRVLLRVILERWGSRDTSKRETVKNNTEPTGHRKHCFYYSIMLVRYNRKNNDMIIQV